MQNFPVQLPVLETFVDKILSSTGNICGMQEILGFTAIPQMFPVLETFVDTILSSTGNICGPALTERNPWHSEWHPPCVISAWGAVPPVQRNWRIKKQRRYDKVGCHKPVIPVNHEG